MKLSAFHSRIRRKIHVLKAVHGFIFHISECFAVTASTLPFEFCNITCNDAYMLTHHKAVSCRSLICVCMCDIRHRCDYRLLRLYLFVKLSQFPAAPLRNIGLSRNNARGSFTFSDWSEMESLYYLPVQGHTGQIAP